MPEDKEYLPSSQRDEGVEHLEEGMGLSEKIDDLEEQKNKDFPNHPIDKMSFSGKAIDMDDCDQEEPMTKERAIYMMGKIFPIELGSRVRNKLSEDGMVVMVGVDFRGVLYLVRYGENKTFWETEHEIKLINYGSNAKLSEEKKSAIKTDVPDPRKIKKKPNEIEGTAFELG